MILLLHILQFAPHGNRSEALSENVTIPKFA